MKQLFLSLFGHKEDNTPVVQHVQTNKKPLDMEAFSSWCKELGVSSRVSKNTEFVVRMGQKQKIVQLNTF